MATNLETYNRFIPKPGNSPSYIYKNETYFTVTFLGGNYYSNGTFLQRIFGGSSEVALMAGLKLPSAGGALAASVDPTVMLDKRVIKAKANTNIPMETIILEKIPAYPDSFGLSFKIVVTKKNDNFSASLDVLNDTANKGVISSLVTGGVLDKVLGVGNVVKGIFDKIDQVNNGDLLQLIQRDFLINSSQSSQVSNALQEGYIVIFLKDEQDFKSVSAAEDEKGPKELEFGKNSVTVPYEESVNINRMKAGAADGNEAGLEYDDNQKILTYNKKVVRNTYLVFQITKQTVRGENSSTSWYKKYAESIQTLRNAFPKDKTNLQTIQPKAIQLFVEGSVALEEDQNFLVSERQTIRSKYQALLQTEVNNFS